jgi:transcriptional regulator with XRE-family HTH domain
MREDRIGQSIRALRHRRGWTQTELGLGAGCSASAISRLERGLAPMVTLDVVGRVLEALDARLVTKVLWRGGELDRLLDADHSALQQAWSRRKARAGGWIDRQEVTYNVYGERGSIDDLAYHPDTRTLLVSELKTGIFDAQETLARLDQKERLARQIAARFGWQVDRVVPCLVVAETRTNRRRLDAASALFARFGCRSRSASAWLHAPSSAVGGLLVFENLSDGHHTHTGRPGRQRVRPSRRDSSVRTRPKEPRTGVSPA